MQTLQLALRSNSSSPCAGPGSMAGAERSTVASASDKHSATVTVLVILAWYTANIALVLLNKFLLSSTKFRQPCFLSLCHMAACVGMGLLISATGTMPLKPLKSRQQFGKIAVLAVMFCASIVRASKALRAWGLLRWLVRLMPCTSAWVQVLGNASLEFIPVSFNQAIGATTPFFTAIFAFALQGTRENLITYMTLIPIVGGIAIASGGEPMFHILGFTFCLLATAGRALKSVAQSMILSDPAEKLDAMSLLLYMSAVCVALLVPLTLFFEPGALKLTSELVTATPHFAWWLLANSMLAYFVNLTK